MRESNLLPSKILNTKKENLEISQSIKHPEYLLFVIIALLSFLFLSFPGYSQINNIIFTESTGNTFTSISSSGTSVNLNDDANIQVNIGFSFIYNSHSYTNVMIGSNGYIGFGSTGATSYSNDLSTTSSTVNEYIAPLWDDLNPQVSGSNIYYTTQGSSPNRQFIIEYNNVATYGNQARTTVQVVLFEVNTNIEFRYGASSGHFSASIGLIEGNGGSGHFMSLTPGNPTTTSTTTSNNSIYYHPASGTTYVFSYGNAPSNLNESSIGSTSASLDWTENGSATTWKIEYGAVGFTKGTGTVITTTTKPYSLTGLSTNTSYSWYVQSVSGSQTSIWVGPKSFTTLPGAHQLPLSESFENGFSYFSNNNGNTVDFAIATNLYHNGSHSVRNQNTNNNVNVFTETGVLDLSSTSDNIILEFWQIAKTEGHNDKCYVEISTDGGQNYTKLPASTYLGSAATYSTYPYFHEDSYSQWGQAFETPDNTWWKKETFKLANYRTTNVRFRFRVISNTTTQRAGWYIDDIHIYENNYIDPSALSESSITQNSVSLNWTENGTATTWNIEYGVAGFTKGTGTVVNTTSKPLSITGLTANTEYDWYVRADYGSGNTSEWVGKKSFKTLLPSNPFPLTEDFENGYTYFDNASTNNKNYNDETTIIHGGGHSVKNAYSTQNINYLEENGVLDLSSASNKIVLEFWHIAKVESPNVYCWIEVSTDGGSTYNSLPINSYKGTSKYNSYGYFQEKSYEKWGTGNNSPTNNWWHKEVFDLSAYRTTDVRFRFHLSNNSGQIKSGWYIDDIHVFENNQQDPSSLTESNITNNSAELNWTEEGSASSWKIKYGVAGFDPNTSGTTISTNSKPYTLNGLSAVTTYEWYVQSVYGSSFTDWTGPVKFTTEQDPSITQSIPFYENWESNSFGTRWNYGTGYKGKIDIDTISNKFGSYGVNLRGYYTSSYTIPSDINDALTKAITGGANENWTNWCKMSIDLSSTTKPYLSFLYSMGFKYNNNYNSFWVQISTDNVNWTDLFSTQTNYQDIDYNRKQIDISTYNGNSKVYIRFLHNGKYTTNYLYLDNIRIEDNSCVSPNSQSINTLNTTSATLNWAQNGGLNSWDIELVKSGECPSGIPTKTSVTKPYNYTGLTPNTYYDWYVRSKCNSNSTSIWYGSNSGFRTVPINSDTCQGKTSKCSPMYVRLNENGSNSYRHVFYDEFSFTVPITGNYSIAAHWNVVDGYLHLYKNSFDPNDASTNWIAGNDDDATSAYSTIEDINLKVGITYIVIGTSYDEYKTDKSEYWIEGAGKANMPTKTNYHGAPYRNYNIPTTNGTAWSSEYECEDDNGYTYYYDDNSTSINFDDDNLLLAVKKNGNNFGSTSVEVKGSTGASYISPATTPYVNSFNGWYMFNRYWKLTPTSQPSSDITVRFYYTSDDFSQLNTALTANNRNAINDHTAMSFVKINDLNSSNYDYNPANGQNQIPKATAYNTDGAWIYKNGDNASTNRWKYGTYNGAFYAEFVISHFSGGGGGAAGNGYEGSLPISLLDFNGKISDNYNTLYWETATEENVDFFEIERLDIADNSTSTIGRAEAIGNSNTIQHYYLEDTTPVVKAFYRLKEVDYDGIVTKFDWITLDRNKTNTRTIDIYPNPAHNYISFSNLNEKALIEIYSFDGEIILNKILNNCSKLDISNLKKGLYLIKITTNSHNIFNQKFIKI
ncbi:MAG: hypothetical protein DRI86_03135 [Bacteroidetes bacterium]|nr:MAG: hypothetical protein DRI86_03135 [Bacteroidota bacterium]